jgi:translocation and assembly module TamB
MHMSDDPKPNLPPDRDSQSDSQKRPGFWFRILIWAKRPSTIAILVSLLALGTGGTVWAYLFITQKLAPLVSQQISTIVNREVELGKVERFSLNSIRFGRSQMPPTETDPDRLSIQGIEVGFNIIPLLFKRTLPLSITLEELDVYIEQDESGAWVDLNITSSGKPLPVEIPTTIKIPDAEIVLLAAGKQIPLSVNLDLTAELSEQFKRAKYDLEAGIQSGTIPPTPLKKGGDSGTIPPTPLIMGAIRGRSPQPPLKRGAIRGRSPQPPLERGAITERSRLKGRLFWKLAKVR